MVASLHDRPTKARFWEQIQGKLVLLLLVLLLPMLLFQAYTLYARFEMRRADELHANLELARAVAKSFETFVQDVLHEEFATGLAIMSLKADNTEYATRLLQQVQSYSRGVRDFSWVNTDGKYLYSSNPAMVGADCSDRSYFYEISGGREWTVSDLVVGRVSGQASFAISQGARDENGILIGIIVATVSPEQLTGVLASERGRGGAFSIVDSKGMLVYRNPEIKVPWEDRNWLKQYPIYEDALKGKEIEASAYASFEGRTRLFALTPIPSIGWVAGAGRTEEIAMAAATAAILPQAIAFMLIILAALGAALILSRSITTPVKQLRDYAMALGLEDSHKPAIAASPSELRDLADSFNEMAVRLQSRENELRRQREWLGVTLNSIGDAVIATDTAGSITFLNPVATDLTGWKVDEAIGQPIKDVFRMINEKTREPAEDIVGRVLAERHPIALSNNTALISRDGTEIPVEDSAAPIKDKAGKVSGVILVFHDVTEKRRAHNALLESEERFRALNETSPVGVGVSSADGMLLYTNPAYEEILGYSPGELLGKKASDLYLDPDDRNSWLGAMKAGGAVRNVELSGPVHKFDDVF